MSILLFNAGSSSLKSTLLDACEDEVIARATADWSGPVTRYRFAGLEGQSFTDEVPWRGHAEAVRRVLADLASSQQLGELSGVGHRVVHGGRFTSPVRLTAEIRTRIEELTALAPLHNPPSLEAIAAAESVLPDVPHVAVFDTSFHGTLPAEAFTYPVPEQWTRDWGIRRYGFHGLSHAYCAERAAELLNRPADLRLVICHLGHGSSASAVHRGRCVDTTMGFTPLDGLMMATRCGALDPGIVLHVQQRYGRDVTQVVSALNRESGLLGVSGVSADMREVLAAAEHGNERAQLAIGIYTHRARQAIGGLAVTLGGVDALVFTAGVGEHAADIRSSICVGLECLGLDIDPGLNATCRPDADVSRTQSPGRILVIATREDVTMLREVVRVLEGGS